MSVQTPERAPTVGQALGHGRTLTSILMTAIFAVMVFVALGFPWPANFMPLIIGVPGLALSLLQIVLDVRDFRRQQGRIDPRTEFERYMDEIAEHTKGQVTMEVAEGTQMQVLLDERPEVKVLTRGQRERRLFGYFFGLVAMVLVFGFWISVPVFLIAFLRFYGHESWKLTLTLALVTWALLYGILAVMLQQVMFEGFLTSYLMEIWFAE